MIVRRIGLMLAVLFSLLALVPALDIAPEADTGQIGALSILVLAFTGTIAIVTVALVVPAWRGGRGASIKRSSPSPAAA